MKDLTEWIKWVEGKNEIIQSYESKIQQEREELKELPKSLAKQLGLEYGDKVILHLLDYRDDRVHCIQFEQKIECIFDQLYLRNLSLFNDRIFFIPTVYTKTKSSKKRKRHYAFPTSLSWRLLDAEGNTILENIAEEIIIDGTYTVGEIVKMRKRYFENQIGE